MDIRHISPGEEFTGQAIFSLARDRDGFAWMSARSVITRYDGRDMTHYRLNSSEIITDNDGIETTLRLAADSSLWAFTDNGKIFFYDCLSDGFSNRFDLSSIDSSIRLHDIYIDSQGNMLLGTSDGLYILKNGESHESFLRGLVVNKIEYLGGTSFALGTSEGVRLAAFNSRPEEKAAFFTDRNIISLHHDPATQSVWSGSFLGEIECIRLRTGETLLVDLGKRHPEAPVRALTPLDENLLLAGFDGAGVYRIDKNDNTGNFFLGYGGYPGVGLSANGVYDIMVDGSRVWVSTYTGGVTIANISDSYHMTAHVPYEPQSLINDHVHAVMEDRDGDIWFATAAGVSMLKPATGEWTHHIDDGKTYLTLTEDLRGNVWCGGYIAGIKCIDKKRGVVRTINSLEGWEQTDCIYASLCEDNGDLWFGGLFNPLTRMSDPGGSSEDKKTYDIIGVHSITPIGADSLLICTNNGFYIFDKRSGYFRHYFGVPESEGLETISFIYTGLADGTNLWLGTSGGGLNCYDMATGAAVNYSTYDGLPSNFIYLIIRTGNGNLWISTGNGIFCFDPADRKVLFTVSDLPVNNFVFMSGTVLRNGGLVFGSPKGALFIDPARLHGNTEKAGLFFTGLKVLYNNVNAAANPEIISTRLDDAKTIHLSHKRNSFSIGFTSLDLYSPGKYVFSYRLDGFDEGWSPEGNYHAADYTNIPPGRYSFEVMCKNKSTPGDVVIRSINIRIYPPFWATVWAYVLYAAAGILLIRWGIIYVRKKNENRRFDDKINFFVSVAHDIRTPLSLILAPLNDVAKEEQMSEKAKYCINLAHQNGKRLNTQLSRLLDFHKMESGSGSLEYSPIDAAAYLLQKENEFAPLARKKNIVFSATPPVEDFFISVDFDKLNHILDNLLSNAIKYTPENGEVTLGFRVKGNKMTFEVRDNGVGIDAKDRKKILKDFYRTSTARENGSEGKGIGLAIAQRLAKMMKGRLEVESEKDRGSIFRLTLPYSPVHLPEGPTEKIQTATEVEQPGTPGKNPEDRSGGRNRILIVEDNQDMRNYLVYSLSPEYRTFAVGSATEAAEFLKSQVVDIVVTDLVMDGTDGISLCRGIKENFETSHLFVILLTASNRQEDIIEAFEAGADDYITKPFSTDMLRMKVSNLLHTRAKIQQHYLTSALAAETPAGSPGTQDKLQPVNSRDDDFIKKAVKLVTDNIANPDFTINELCREMAMSRTLVYEKLRAMVGQSPSEFIRVIRLRHARELLLSGRYSITDVTAMTGFSDTKYFSTVFKKYYGESPGRLVPRK